MNGTDYIKIVNETIDRAWNTQRETLDRAADAIAEAVIAKRNVFVFGCSHAGILAEEVFYRTGGLAVINPIFYPGMMLNTRPITNTSKTERIPGLGKEILDGTAAGEGDVLIIHSVSGRNTVPVEMALYAKEKGLTVICITNLKYSSSVTSRHGSGKRLFEVGDIVIDNMGEVGDAAVTVEGLLERIGPTSTAVGAAIINGVVIDAVNRIIKAGIVPPVFMSANLDGGDEHNARIFEEYKNNIFYM
ncbi:MAG: SIS domain-containing protein [Clostridia bacterium]|nr:SIS domain-containing protein [Clostridia bacterium]